jgi:hypothetical protein
LHVHHANEELLLVLAGTLAARSGRDAAPVYRLCFMRALRASSSDWPSS